jgi:short-subunit dehydrogenase
MSAPRPVTLITGASAGIGWALAEIFARHGHELVLVARRMPELERLADTLAASGAPRPTVLSVDLGQASVGDRIAAELSARGLAPRNVVNNAGFGLIGPADELDRAEQLAMIDLNVRTLTDLSLAFIPSLTEHRGGLLNVASVAGFLPGPGMAVYYATKAYVLSFSEALHHELAGLGVRVTALCPGPVATGFQARAGLQRDNLHILALSARRVARIGYRGFMRGERVVVAGIPNRIVASLLRFIPHGLLLSGADQRGRSVPRRS